MGQARPRHAGRAVHLRRGRRALRVRAESGWFGGLLGRRVGQPVPDAPGPFEALDMGIERTCGLRPDGAAVCWGQWGQEPERPGPFTVGDGRLRPLVRDTIHRRPSPAGDTVHPARPEPAGGAFRSIRAGTDYTCGIRSDRHGRLLGGQRVRPDKRAERELPGPGRRPRLRMRDPNRRHRQMLGEQRVRPDRRSRRAAVQNHIRRRAPRLRAGHRSHDHLLGQGPGGAVGRPLRGVLRGCSRPLSLVRAEHGPHCHLLGMGRAWTTRISGRDLHRPDHRGRPRLRAARPTALSPAGVDWWWKARSKDCARSPQLTSIGYLTGMSGSPRCPRAPGMPAGCSPRGVSAAGEATSATRACRPKARS